MRLVTEELARLDHETERAERAAERWEQITARFDAQHATHQAEDKDSAAVLRRAEDAAEQVRAEVTGPLTVQAKADGAAYLDAVAEEAAASGRLATVGRFGKRKARAEQRTATVRIRTLRGQVSQEWASTPANPDRLPEWAGQVANKRAGSDPRVTEAAQTVEAATADRDTMRKRHQQERTALLVSEYGAEHAQAARYGMRRTTNPAVKRTTPRTEPRCCAQRPMNSASSRSPTPPSASRPSVPSRNTPDNEQRNGHGNCITRLSTTPTATTHTARGQRAGCSPALAPILIVWRQQFEGRISASGRPTALGRAATGWHRGRDW